MATHDTAHVDVQTFGRTMRQFVYEQHLRSLARAANQVGKTLAGAYKGILFSHGKQGVPAPNVLAVLVADIVNVYGEFCAKIHEVMDPALLDPRCKYIEGEGYRVGSKRALRFKNGSRWLFRTSEGQQIGAASFTADGGWIDEIPKLAHYNEFVRGLASKDAPLWVTLTVIGRPANWFWCRVEGDAEYRATKGTSGEPPEVDWTQYVAELNRDECPWRTQTSIDQQIADTDHAERPQRIYAKWEGVTPDREYTAYGPACELEEMPEVDFDGLHFGLWADHGERAGREFIVLACWSSRMRKMWLLDEYVNTKPTTPEEDAVGVLEMFARNGIDWTYIDSWMGDVNSSGKSVAGSPVNDELAKALAKLLGFREGDVPIVIDKPSKGRGSVERSIRLVNTAFMRGQLKVLPSATRLRHAYQHIRKGDEDLKHGPDCVGYGAVPIVMEWGSSGAGDLYLSGR